MQKNSEVQWRIVQIWQHGPSLSLHVHIETHLRQYRSFSRKGHPLKPPPFFSCSAELSWDSLPDAVSLAPPKLPPRRGVKLINLLNFLLTK
jgi:hypothetical protein